MDWHKSLDIEVPHLCIIFFIPGIFKILNLIDIKVMHVINILVKSKELMSKSKTIFSMFDILAKCCRLYIDDGML